MIGLANSEGESLFSKGPLTSIRKLAAVERFTCNSKYIVLWPEKYWPICLLS